MIIPPGFAQAAWHFSIVGSDRPAVVTCGVALGGAEFGENRVASLHAAWETSMLPGQSNQCRLERATLKYGPSETGPTFEFAEQSAGGNTGTPLTSNVALLVRKRTALGGRANRGRFYVPGIPEAVFDGAGQMSSSDVAAWGGRAQALFDALVAAEMEPVILHNSVSDPTPVVTFVVDTLAATQRRRLRA